MVKKDDVKAEKEVVVPLGGYHEVWKAEKANELVSSGEWRCVKVCDNGKYVMVRTK